MNTAEVTLPAAKRQINPVLIKEIRQGVRSRLYAISFIAVQVFMLFYLLFSMAETNNRETDFFFWLISGLFLIVILPITGANALSSEKQGSRLELLLLTGISTRQIAYGKWLAIIAQSVLLVTALLPYIVLRYYIGAVEFLESLLYVALLLIASAIITGLTVALSSIRIAAVRWLLIVVGGVFALPAPLVFLFSAVESPSDAPLFLAMVLCVGGLFVALCIEFAAARLSPIEENHDTAKRLIVWGLLAATAAFGFIDNETPFPLITLCICFAIVSWDGLCRGASAAPSIYEPFVRRGQLGKLAGGLLYPGWRSSLAFTLFTFAALLLVQRLTGQLVHDDPLKLVVYFFLCVGALIFPFAILLLTPLAHRRYGMVMFLIQLCIVLVTQILHLAERATAIALPAIVCWIPTSVLQLILLNDDSNFLIPSMAYLIGGMVTTALALIVIIVKSRSQRRLVRQAEAAALASLQKREAMQGVDKNAAVTQHTGADR